MKTLIFLVCLSLFNSSAFAKSGAFKALGFTQSYSRALVGKVDSGDALVESLIVLDHSRIQLWISQSRPDARSIFILRRPTSPQQVTIRILAHSGDESRLVQLDFQDTINQDVVYELKGFPMAAADGKFPLTMSVIAPDIRVMNSTEQFLGSDMVEIMHAERIKNHTDASTEAVTEFSITTP